MQYYRVKLYNKKKRPPIITEEAINRGANQMRKGKAQIEWTLAQK